MSQIKTSILLLIIIILPSSFNACSGFDAESKKKLLSSLEPQNSEDENSLPRNTEDSPIENQNENSDSFTISMSFDKGVKDDVILSENCSKYGEPVFTSDASRTTYSDEVSYGPGLSAKMTIEHGKRGFGSFGGIVNFSSCDQLNGRNIKKGEEIWVRFKIYFPNGFEFNQNGRNKFLRLRTFHDESGNKVSEGYNDLYINAPPGLSPGRDQPFHYIFEGEQQWYPMGQDSDFFKPNTWHTVEYYLKLDDKDASNGGDSTVRAWIDGRLIGETRMRNTLLTEQSYIESLYFFTYWDNDGAHKTQSLWVDDLIITTLKPQQLDDFNNRMIGP